MQHGERMIKAMNDGDWRDGQPQVAIHIYLSLLVSVKILRRSSQGNPSVGGVKHKRGIAEYSDFGPIERYISETVQDRS